LVLKTAIFATGLAGIVAEFVLSTLATYILGDAVFQWTVVMSLMLFAMGLGSRLSRLIGSRLLEAFIAVEFCLSLLCAASSTLAYGLSAFSQYINIIIYGNALAIGLLIGLEIPLVTRLNQSYEELKTNIAAVMEKDYYGALLGGLFFAFFALPHLGLTYTPIVLGAVNFLVAMLAWLSLHRLVRSKWLVGLGASVCALMLLGLCIFAEPIIMFGEQLQYRDKVIHAQQTSYQKIVITQWRDNYWLFINGQEQFSTADEERYHEPLVHPVMQLSQKPKKVLILGGGDGLALREVLKYPQVQKVTLVDIDPAMTRLAKEFPVLVSVNQGSMLSRKLEIINQDARIFAQECESLYDAIIIDLPDPDSTDLMHLYSLGFYKLLKAHLSPGGFMVTQAGSPYFAPKAFLCILKTIRAAGFEALPYHNQVPTMGEWGWVLAGHGESPGGTKLAGRMGSLDFTGIPTRYLNRDAARAMTGFGKGLFEKAMMDSVEINTRHKPVLAGYYRDGRWETYR
jgi:spermidine synthase